MADTDVDLWVDESTHPVNGAAETSKHEQRSKARFFYGVAALAAGVLVTVLAMTTLRLDGAGQVLVGGGGVVVAYLGLDRTSRWFFGESFQVAVWLCGLWLAVMVLSAILADFLPLSETQDVSKTLFEPTLLRPDLLSKHPLGTDRQGLDILGGLIFGARVSLTVGVGAALTGMAIGTMIGMTSGFFRGRYDSITSLLCDSVLAFPPLILLLAMVAVLSPSVRNVTIALAVLGVPTYIRLSRANTILFGEREFVLASRALGARPVRILLRELLPNVMLPVVSFAFVSVALLIVAEASLSFLGLSIQRPRPTWGNMIAAGQADFEHNPHLVFIPGVVLFFAVYALNRLGDRARTAWDSRQSRI